MTAEKPTINWRDYERTNEDVKKAEVLKIPPERIRIKVGFNPRDLSKPETQEKINNIKLAYKAGDYVKPIEVSLSGTEVEVVDGHCRLTAAMLAKAELVAEGIPDAIPYLVCVPFKGNDLERLVHTVHGNEGEKLTPIECAEVVRRMTGLGLKRDDIASKLRFSVGWVDRLIVLTKLPEKVKGMVRDGLVSPEVAVKVFKLEGEVGVVDAIEKRLEEAKSQGQNKVTQRHVAPDKDAIKEQRKALRKLTEARFSVSQDLALALPPQLAPGKIKDDEEYTITLTGAVLKKLKEIQAAFANADYVAPDHPVGGGEWPFQPKGGGAGSEAGQQAA